MKLNYTSFEDLSNTIRKNAWKIPEDVDLIVGVPRSGLMAALIVGEYLGKPVIDLNGFIEGKELQLGNRKYYTDIKTTNFRKVLVLDDTVFTGNQINNAKNKVASLNNNNILFGCIYAEGKNAKEMVNIYLEDNYDPNEKLFHLYEWNILHHGNMLSTKTMFDMDGILCKEPPDERNTNEYIKYIQNALPMIKPSSQIGAIVTYRLNKYRKLTEEWLKKVGVQYNQLYMMNANSWEERANMCSPAQYKAYVYKKAEWAILFVESDKWQAQEISKLSNKPVWCYEDGKMYQ